ncbi:hypothetical protein AB6E89_12530 [Vibrio breoganii]
MKLENMSHIDQLYDLINNEDIDAFWNVFANLFPKGKFMPKLDEMTSDEKIEKAWDVLGHSTMLVIELEKRFYETAGEVSDKQELAFPGEMDDFEGEEPLDFSENDENDYDEDY